MLQDGTSFIAHITKKDTSLKSLLEKCPLGTHYMNIVAQLKTYIDVLFYIIRLKFVVLLLR